MNTRAQTLRNTVFSSVGMYTEYVLGMLTSIVIARHLGPDGFGAYSVVIWLVAIGVAMTNSGTASAAIKFVAELRGAGKVAAIPPLVKYLRRAQRRFLAVVLMAGAALFVFAGEHVAPGMNHALLLGFLVVATSLRSSYMFNIGVAKGFENFRATAIVAVVSTPVNLALVIAAMWLDAPVEWLLGVFTVSSVMFYLVSRWQIASLAALSVAASSMPQLPPDLLARVRRHMCLSAMIVSVGFIAASEVEVLFLNLHGDPHAAGHFKVAYQLAIGSAALVPGVFGALLLPMMANALSQGRDIAGRRFVASTGYLALLAAPLVAFGVVFSGPLIQFLYGPEYSMSAPVFSACLFGAALTTLTQGGSSLLISADRQRSVLLLVVACGGLKVGLDAILIAYYGLNGAAMAYVAVSVACAFATMALAIRVSGTAPDWLRLLRIALAAGVAGVAASSLRGQMSPLATIMVGGLLLTSMYVPLTLLLGCWSRGDIEHMQQLHQRFVAGRPHVSARFLQWIHERAPGETTS